MRCFTFLAQNKEPLGKTTVLLRKSKQAGSRLSAPVGAESRSVSVVDAAGFQAGDAIGIFDKKTVG
jgi:hypothetical protein